MSVFWWHKEGERQSDRPNKSHLAQAYPEERLESRHRAQTEMPLGLPAVRMPCAEDAGRVSVKAMSLEGPGHVTRRTCSMAPNLPTSTTQKIQRGNSQSWLDLDSPLPAVRTHLQVIQLPAKIHSNGVEGCY
jgi:hypothetical protein